MKPRITIPPAGTNRIAEIVGDKLQHRQRNAAGRRNWLGMTLVPVKITGIGSDAGYYEGVEVAWQDDLNNERWVTLSGGRTFNAANVGELFCVDYTWFGVAPNNGATGSAYASFIGRTVMAFAIGGIGTQQENQWAFMQPPRRALEVDDENKNVVFQYRKPMIKNLLAATTYGGKTSTAVGYSANSADYIWIVGTYGGDFSSTLVLDASGSVLPSGDYGAVLGYIETDASNNITDFQDYVNADDGAFAYMFLPGGVTATRTVNNGTSNETWQLVNGMVVNIS